MTTTIGDAGPESGHGSDDHSDQPGGLDELLDRHGPTPIDYQQKEAVSKALQNGASIDAIVIAGDIRRSTSLMKEAVSFQVYAQIINRFVTAIQIATRSCGGWFDKFTGDGFLAFWVTTGDASLKGTVLRNVVEYARQQRVFFGELILPDLRLNSQNFPAGVGFAVGIDGGPTYPATIAGQLTIVGPPVVGAVRMLNTAGPGEILLNVRPGQSLYDYQSRIWKHGEVEVTQEWRKTKEYEQQVFPVVSKDDSTTVSAFRKMRNRPPRGPEPLQAPPAPESPSA
ncbi:MAG: hypothetical protein ABSB99_11525 [Acidimicrobiales bacterium]